MDWVGTTGQVVARNVTAARVHVVVVVVDECGVTNGTRRRRKRSYVTDDASIAVAAAKTANADDHQSSIQNTNKKADLAVFNSVAAQKRPSLPWNPCTHQLLTIFDPSIPSIKLFTRLWRRNLPCTFGKIGLPKSDAIRKGVDDDDNDDTVPRKNEMRCEQSGYTGGDRGSHRSEYSICCHRQS
jgi:hypothetical protein